MREQLHCEKKHVNVKVGNDTPLFVVRDHYCEVNRGRVNASRCSILRCVTSSLWRRIAIKNALDRMHAIRTPWTKGSGLKSSDRPLLKDVKYLMEPALYVQNIDEVSINVQNSFCKNQSF